MQHHNAQIIGKLMRVREGRLEGYAYNPARPLERLSLAVIVDGVEVATALCAHQYVGIGDAKTLDDYHGFVVALPAQFYDGKKHVVDLRVGDISLTGCPVNATFTLPVPVVADPPIPPARLQGNIDGLHFGTLSGWCCNSVAFDDAITVECLVDGLSVAVVASDIYRSDLAHLGSGNYGFCINIPDELLDNALHHVKIIANSSQPNTNPLELLQSIKFPAITDSYDGRVDLAEHPRVQGWAWNIRNPDEVVELEVLVNGELQGVVQASDMRQDLAKAGVGKGDKAFTYFLPPSLDPSKEYEIEVRFAATGKALRRSPLPLNFSKTATSFNAHIMHKNDGEEWQVCPQIDVERSIWQLHALEKAPPICVIIPIYNAHNEVQKCVAIVLAHSKLADKIILINDASSDGRIKKFLNKLKNDKVVLLHNPQNLGYTTTVNKAILHCPNHDVVLLNSDTRVPPNWLQQLHTTAYAGVNIGTVTAISDNAGAFSVPEIGGGVAAPENLTDDDMGRLIRQNSLHIAPNAPTGNGFCLFIKRDLLNQIGSFDEQLFPRGYGEENEFSMRARKAGWVHKVDDACFVFHQRSASFGDEKVALIENANAVLRQLYPDYAKLASDFCVSPAMQQVRRHVRYLYQHPTKPKPRIMYVLHGNATGGTPYTNRDLMNSMLGEWDIFLMECDRLNVSLKRLIDGEMQLVGQWQLQTPLSLADQFRPDYAAIMLHLLQKYAIELVHIRHLHKHALDLPRIASALHIPVVLSFHDFYFACPTINLLDENQKFCGGVCTKTTPKEGEDCALPYPLDESMPPLKHRFIHRWREEISRIFPYISGFVTTSHFAREIMVTAYPVLAQADFRVIEHGRDFEQQYHLAKTPSPDSPLKIVIAGQMTKHKGAEFIEKLLELDNGKGTIEFHFLGNLPEKYAHLGVFHGSYSRDELPAKVEAIGGHVMGIFSIWPETYCHVLSEAWACGMPVIASNLGALKERIKIHGGGWVADISKPKAAYNKICAIKSNPADYKRKAKAANLQALRTIKAMSDDYVDLYQKIMI